jgi:hypothetical protein
MTVSASTAYSHHHRDKRARELMKFMMGMLFFLLIMVTFLALQLPPPASSSSTKSLAGRLRLSTRRSAKGDRRIAIIIPFVAQYAESLPSYLPAFCVGASHAKDVADFLLFHNGVLDGAMASTSGSSNGTNSFFLEHRCPSNVKFISLGSTLQFAQLLLRVVFDFKRAKAESKSKKADAAADDDDPKAPAAEEQHQEEHDVLAFESRPQLEQLVAKHMHVHPYSLVEFKPAYGYIFQEYLEGYSHWGYSDVDILFGDLGRWIEDDEWSDFDIVTYGYGDQNRAYLRGQFTFHKNVPRINLLWRDCHYLSDLDRRLDDAVRGKAKYKFESAEGCYSAAVLKHSDLRVKYAVKAWTDVNDKHDTVGTHGLYLSRNVDKGRGVIYKPQSAESGRDLLELGPRWFEKDAVYRDKKQPLQVPVGELVEIDLPTDVSNHDANCMYWVQSRYQKTLCLTDLVSHSENLFWINGKLYKRAFETVPLESNVATGPFFHFQEWKRYYRPSQLAPLHLESRVQSFVLTKEGAIPIPDPSFVEPWRSRVTSSPLQASLKHWSILATASSSASTKPDDRSLLPRNLYCLVSGPRKFPPTPPTSECYYQVSWQDETGMEILSGAPGWSTTTVNAELDVTLVLTLQFTDAQTKNGQALAGIVDVLSENLIRWQGRPAVAILHLAGVTEEAVEFLRQRFDPVKNHPSFDNALIAVLYQEEDDAISRKALVNMAIDAVPTRWYVSGLELERGLILSLDSVVFAHRAAYSHRHVHGHAFLIPQFAYEGAVEAAASPGLADLAGEHKLGNVKAPSEMEKLCASDAVVRLEKADDLWWAQLQALLSTGEDSNPDPDPDPDPDIDLSKRALLIQAMELELMEYLTDQHHLKMFALDESPILMTDNVGPYHGIRTDEVAREVEELGGRRCYNGLRLAQLAAFGYKLDTLGGAFAVSSAETRRASSWGIDDGVSGTTRCDGCFMLPERHEEILEDIIKDEIRRAGKAAVIWAEMHELHVATK